MEIDFRNNFHLFKEFIDRNERIIKKFPEIQLSGWRGMGTRRTFSYMIKDYCVSQFVYHSDIQVNISWGEMHYETAWGNTIVTIKIKYLDSQLSVADLEKITDEMLEKFYARQVDIVMGLEKKQKELTIKNKLKIINKEFRKPKDGI